MSERLPQPNQLAVHFRQLGRDLMRVGLKSGFSTFIIQKIHLSDSSRAADTAVLDLIASEVGGGLNFFLGRPSEFISEGEQREESLLNYAESILVGTNPVMIVLLFNTNIGTGNECLAVGGMLLVNAMLLYGARRLGEMERRGGGRDLEG